MVLLMMMMTTLSTFMTKTKNKIKIKLAVDGSYKSVVDDIKNVCIKKNTYKTCEIKFNEKKCKNTITLLMLIKTKEIIFKKRIEELNKIIIKHICHKRTRI